MPLIRVLIALICLCVVTPAYAHPPLPWAEAEARALPPGKPDKDYTPVVAPNGSKAEWKTRDGVKVFHLTAEPIEWEVCEGLKVKTWGYNGSVPGPVLELAAGDRARIYVTNGLPVPTTVHWHGVILPCGMDGVSALTQPAIAPGQTYVYEFTFAEPGTFMYHSHHDTMTQEGMGLVGMIVVHERIADPAQRPDRDFVMMLHEWKVDVGTAVPDPFEMTDFNILTMNGKVLPDTEPLVAALGDRVWIRYGNLSAMDHHPIHLHGYKFKIIGTDGGWAPDPDKLLPETTVLVPVGSTRVTELVADNPGDWIFHCHMTHHTMNQMGHGLPNMIGVDQGDLVPRIRALIPGYMPMGADGMGMMASMHMELPDNSIPMRGLSGQFGRTVMGGMANIFRVREGITSYEDPGPYDFPEGTVAAPASARQMEADGISVKDEQPPAAPMMHHHHH